MARPIRGRRRWPPAFLRVLPPLRLLEGTRCSPAAAAGGGSRCSSWPSPSTTFQVRSCPCALQPPAQRQSHSVAQSLRLGWKKSADLRDMGPFLEGHGDRMQIFLDFICNLCYCCGVQLVGARDVSGSNALLKSCVPYRLALMVALPAFSLWDTCPKMPSPVLCVLACCS